MNISSNIIIVVSEFSSMFLSQKKWNSAVRIGNLVYRLEIREYPDDDEAMNSARKIRRETPETMATAKEMLKQLLKSKTDFYQDINI